MEKISTRMELTQFTPHLLATTRAAWIANAEKLDIPALDYEMALDWADKHINYASANGDSFAYGIFLDGSDEAVAIVDIVYTQRPGPALGWLKLLEVKLAPQYAPAEVEKDMSKFLEVLDIYSEALIGTIKLTGRHMAKVVKLYGRSDGLKQLLLALHERFSNKFANQQYLSKMEGRWLVFSIQEQK